MSDRKLAKNVQDLFKQVWQLYRKLTKAFITWLLRTSLLVNRKTQHSRAGFVLPVTVLLILVVSLAAGSLSLRAFKSSSRVIGEVQNRVIYNAATPAVERARAKVEYLFDAFKDPRYPGGVASEEFLTSMLLNDGSSIKGRSAPKLDGTDPYTLPDELQWATDSGVPSSYNGRLDINGDGLPDNAWAYRTDTDGNGQADATVVYSILLSTPPATTGANALQGWQRLVSLTDQEKASGKQAGTSIESSSTNTTGANGTSRTISYVRSGPLSNSTGSGCSSSVASTVEGGWYQDSGNSAVLRKNFQVDALVIPDSASKPNGIANFSTLEFQQDRKLDRGNKWGAWFRNDLEVFPGSQFNWNGAMHTEGTLYFDGNNNFSAYLISAPASCLFYESASEITITKTQDTTTNTPFVGSVVSGFLNNASPKTDTTATIHLHSVAPWNNKPGISASNDWANSTPKPFDVSIDPVAIQVRNGYAARNTTDATNQTLTRNSDSAGNSFPNRLRLASEPAPYVDDLYRADNRYGPKLSYSGNSSQGKIPSGTAAGSLIDSSNFLLVGSDPPSGSGSSVVGLDGYWERRARNSGLRVLVGQRLELGNSNGWVAPQDRPNGTTPQDLNSTAIAAGDGDYSTLRSAADYSKTYTATADATLADPDISDNEGDPLYPPYKTISHEARQRRALRDNIAGVQTAAVYHAAVSKDYPVACFTSTAHPATPWTLRQSINFIPTKFIDSTPTTFTTPGAGSASTASTILMSDFFNGRGTNGWEFEPPMGSEAAFNTAIADSTSALRIGLSNLANFAGDHISDTKTGAFPPSQLAGEIHPNPALSMWGNYSNLRRTLAQLNAGTTYANLSPADKTYLQTAACTLGALAYNIDRAQRFDPTNQNNDIAYDNQPNATTTKTYNAGTSKLMTDLGNDLFALMNGDVTDGEVLPQSRLSTYGYKPSGSGNDPDLSLYNPRDYDRVPAEAFLGQLRESYIVQNVPLSADKLRMAELILSHFQIRRDRTYGFRPSPAANTWNYNPYVVTGPGPTPKGKNPSPAQSTLWSSACDPNIFGLSGLAFGSNVNGVVAPNNALALTRLGLSRLCGTVIHAGAVRNYPGDMHYPARADISSTNIQYLPNATDGTAVTAAPVDTYINPVQDPSITTGNAQQNLFRKIQQFFEKDNAKSDLINNAAKPFVGEQYKRASVAPKWPSLYYLFPEVAHDQKGKAELKNSILVDHRQPDGNLFHVNPADATTDLNNKLPAAFQPWAEPYITDSYVNTVNPATAGGDRYKVVVSGGTPASTDTMAQADVGYSVAAPNYTDPVTNGKTIKQTYRTFGRFLPNDISVASIALNPRKLPTSSTAGTGSGFTNPTLLANSSTWQLPVGNLGTSPTDPAAQNTAPNRILVPSGDTKTGTVAAIPFLDRVLFDGREWLPTRVLDIDLGILRRTRPGNQMPAGTNPDVASNEVWLPTSGIVYSFREDAIREDAINRPATASTTCTGSDTFNYPPCTSATNSASQTDPPLKSAYSGAADPKISVKPLDYVADPERRPYGFRLRNGTQLNRHSNLSIAATDNVRGLSFFSDNPLYVMGNYNLHQDGNDDTVGTRLEEFTEQLPTDGVYNEDSFYKNRKTLNTKFASPTQDRWRPSELFADSINILSDSFCDGSVLDTFMTAGDDADKAKIQKDTITGQKPDRYSSLSISQDDFKPYKQKNVPDAETGAAMYGEVKHGLYGPGCSNNNMTSFSNQNRPTNKLKGTEKNFNGDNANYEKWDWGRENPTDYYSSLDISRNGNVTILPLNDDLVDPTKNKSVRYLPSSTPPADEAYTAQRPLVSTDYNLLGDGDLKTNAYYFENGNRKYRDSQSATDTRVNSIIVNGIVPSRVGQSYGGMHNFPRFQENWNGKKLWFSGSFLQLNFSNYATAPYDQDAFEPAATASESTQYIDYYWPPARLWGYDVALQFAPAGPAASRFVTASKDRNEFYKEPTSNDPYIQNLCKALPDSIFPDSKCPS